MGVGIWGEKAGNVKRCALFFNKEGGRILVFGGCLVRKSAQRKALRAFIHEEGGRSLVFGGRWGRKSAQRKALRAFFPTNKAVNT